jgi:hypothetical protein
MLAVQTWDDPPNRGKIIFAIMGCTKKSRAEFKKIVKT